MACWLITIFLDAGFDFFQNTRIEYYMEGDYVSEEVFKGIDILTIDSFDIIIVFSHSMQS